MNGKLFLSHSHGDKEDVQRLRRALDLNGVPVWEDVRELRADARLTELEARVKESRAVVAVLSQAGVESEWLRREVAWAREHGRPVFAIVPPDGAKLASLLVGERLCVPVAGDVVDAVPAILDALSGKPLAGRIPVYPPKAPARSELILRFSDAKTDTEGGRHRAAGRLDVVHRSATGEEAVAPRVDFVSPLRPEDLGELAWYLEQLPRWAFAEHLVRGREVEAKLPVWGRALHDAAFNDGLVKGFLAEEGHRRLVVEVHGDGPEAAALLALPWELLRDEEWWFAGRREIRVLRRLPRTQIVKPLPLAERLRVLLVVSRTNDGGFLDLRVSMTPLVQALEPLGQRVEVEVLADATLPALEAALRDAADRGEPFQVVHFDGHGVYDRHRGLGLLVFEHPEDAGKDTRRSELVDAAKLGAILAGHRVPLFVLEACQTAQTDQRVENSVAAKLLVAGVGSVVAMSHAVLVETARRFVGPFYAALAKGDRIGRAMVIGQQALHADSDRGGFALQDWFVPILFQDHTGDVGLLPAGPLPELGEERERRLAATPELPRAFVGRARELLVLHRRLYTSRLVALVAAGGQGKTAIAIEAARWELAIRRFERLAWVSVEEYGEVDGVVDAVGRQLVAGWTSAAKDDHALIDRALADWRVLVVVDNLESVLADRDPALLELLGRWSKVGGSRVLVTSREVPPDSLGASVVGIGALSPSEGKELVATVLKRATAKDEEDVARLVETVGGHARSLVLLAPYLDARGLRPALLELGPILAELEAANPGDRENSLLASVRLSLGRLGQRERELVRGLAVFRQAAEVRVLARVLEVPVEEALGLGRALIEVGLADAQGSVLVFEPALPLAVVGEVEAEELERMRGRWLGGMVGLIGFLVQLRSTQTGLAAATTRAAIGEILATVDAFDVAGAGSDAMDVLTRTEALCSNLGRTRVLAHIAALRTRVAGRGAKWGPASFQHEQLEVERALAAGDVGGALRRASRLRGLVEGAGPDAYPGADFHLAMAENLVGQALVGAGLASEAIERFETSRRLFEVAGDFAPGSNAARMAVVCMFRRADALADVGRLDEAGAGLLEAVASAEAAGAERDVAAGRFQLGTVRMLQGRPLDALNAYREARSVFDQLGEPRSVAATWHQEAMVHRRTGKFGPAEGAYLTALEIATRLGLRREQASTLDDLGLLFQAAARAEEAVGLHRQAAVIRRGLGDSLTEARSLSNLAIALHSLDRLADARAAILEAIQIKSRFGAVGDPWKSHAILADLEPTPEAAAIARAEAVRLYHEYRAAGGSPQFEYGRRIEQIRAALRTNDPATVLAENPDLPAPLGAVLTGQPVDFSQLSYDVEAELLLLQKSLQS